MKPFLYSAVFVFLAYAVFPAQPDSLPSHKKTEHYFRFQYDNDFFSATDRYYTQGVLVMLIHPVLKHSPVFYILPKISKIAVNYFGITLEQDVFTPKSIRYNGGAIYYGERPFTAVFFLSHTLASLDQVNNTALHTQLDLGILGPGAKGEEEQKGIHKALDNIEPLGWENQLAADYVVNYRARLEKGFITLRHFDCVGSAAARLGTLYTDAGVGLQLRFGRLSPYFNSLGLEKKTAPDHRPFKIYLTARANARAVGYNATLQGGLTNNGNIYELPGEAIARFVADASCGITLSYKKVSLEYARFYITPEFAGGIDHGWGKCVISVAF